MSPTPIQKTRNKLAKIYAAGILIFTAITGAITALVKFLAHLNLS